MSKRKQLPRWRVFRIGGNRAREITTVPAPDADKAIEEVIRLYDISEDDRDRLIARPA
jgi:hypothetical protein